MSSTQDQADLAKTTRDSADASVRTIVVHYHLFKNAGSSVDAALREFFGRTWCEFESSVQSQPLRPHQLAEFITAHPEVLAVSSHTAVFPVPRMPGTAVFPIAFVRHPIDRIRSIYEFERRQEPAIQEGAIVAKELDFKGYVEWRLPRDKLIRNFHVSRFAMGVGGAETLDNARRYAEELPFIGVVEMYAPSLRSLQRHLRAAFPGIVLPVMHVNVTRDKQSTLTSRLEQTRQELGEALYADVVACNRDDLEFYDFVLRRNMKESRSRPLLSRRRLLSWFRTLRQKVPRPFAADRRV
jgi:hypothetical protein